MNDEYPSDEILEKIKNWNSDLANLLDFVVDEWNDDYGKVDIRKISDDEYQYVFITGGWSGNEELIDAFSKNFIVWHQLWQSSHRGGKFIFILKKVKI